MTPIYTTRTPEAAVTMLLGAGLRTLVHCVYENFCAGVDKRVRFRPDNVNDTRIWFARVPSQRNAWIKRGGAIISWSWAHNLSHEADAVMYQECPKSMEMLWKSCGARVVAVVYKQPSWEVYEEIIRRRYAHKPKKMSRRLTAWAAVSDFVDSRPELTTSALEELCARRAPSPQSGALVLHAGVARSPDTTD